MVRKRDTRLLPVIIEFERVLKDPKLTDEEHDLQLSAIMTQMEKTFGIPYANNKSFNTSFPELIDLYRAIGDARIALGDESVYQIGKKVRVIDGLESRVAKSYSRKEVGSSSKWYLLIDQSEDFGYALDEGTIEWNGKEFIYDCRKWNTPLSVITGRNP
ncbi:hypothetical protein RB620_24585 [Paenibacillus sp. LHD-117]|uniref:hypothetical protein n=1 Tax=Paenibacillus sp. LHD-117 TaxID=3071412 RepID=UPI0027E14A0A|nr:hypothetical protein [Paenibacillus sp. LHD-117]MDQ6422614.1 hypothetical protein [Paenibacillus sp. LHD-117]